MSGHRVPPADLASRVDAIRWYHTLALTDEIVTPGEFDLRGSVNDLPWPKIAGRRCLDVATFDGFYAFEMERRGAAEVVALDLDDAADLDWLPRQVPDGFTRGQEPVGQGFRLAHEVYGSSVQRVSGSVYDLDPDVHGRFDVVVCGALLQHLRDPARALAAIAGVCDGALLSVEHVDPWWSAVARRTPVARLHGKARTWSLLNRAGHLRLLDMAGFDVVMHTLVGVPFGAGFTARPSTVAQRARRAWVDIGRAAVGTRGAPPFSAVRAVPAAGLVPPPS